MVEHDEATAPVRSKIFISYCHRDRRWLERLMDYLKPMESLGLIDVWVDTRINPGDLWRDEIDRALNATKVALLLISINFINSRFITEVELPTLLKAAETDGVLILPVFVGSCAKRFLRTPDLCRFQAVNPPSSPLSSMTPNQRDQLWDDLADRIQDLLTESGSPRLGPSA